MMSAADWAASAAWLHNHREVIATIQSLLASLAIVAALVWFLRQTKLKQRVQFDLGCNFIRLKSRPTTVIAERYMVCPMRARLAPKRQGS